MTEPLDIEAIRERWERLVNSQSQNDLKQLERLMSEADGNEKVQWQLAFDLYCQTVDARIDTAALLAEAERLRKAVRVVTDYKTELFEDGVATDLAADGVTKITDAYMEGHKDLLMELSAEIRAALAEQGANYDDQT